MAVIYDSDIQKSIENISTKLKSLIKAPEWTKFVKTSSAKERIPDSNEWYYMRAAAILVTIYKRGPMGVSKLRTKYGSKKNRGHKPEKFKRASGKIIRTILQQLDKSELTKFKKDGVHKGRTITSKGKSLVDKNSILIKNG